jgi:hypothetical protein
VFAAEGDKFPNCRTCGERASFALAQAASRIDEEPGFGNARKTKAVKRRKKKPPGKG